MELQFTAAGENIRVDTDIEGKYDSRLLNQGGAFFVVQHKDEVLVLSYGEDGTSKVILRMPATVHLLYSRDSLPATEAKPASEATVTLRPKPKTPEEAQEYIEAFRRREPGVSKPSGAIYGLANRGKSRAKVADAANEAAAAAQESKKGK